ncbi:MAG: hypothetical protein RLZZ37_1033 [Actinomycetota bacterium]|jgi:ribonuclease D
MSKSLEEITIEENDFLTHITKPIRKFHLIESDEQLKIMCEKLDEDEYFLAIDTERASGFKYFNKAYLIQVSTETSDLYLIDPINLKDLTILQKLFSSKPWILHAATQDLPCLLELGLKPKEIFDTELAARLLSLPKVGLAGLLEDELAITLDKEHSAVNWSLRPLEIDWLNYAALDVEFLHKLMFALRTKLINQNKLSIAQEEFASLCNWKPSESKKDPWRRTSGMHDIKTGLDSCIVKNLWLKRDEMAKAQDIAPGRLLNDSSIIEIALIKPKTEKELSELKSIKYRSSQQYSNIWFESLQNSLKLDPSSWPIKVPNSEAIPLPKSWEQKNPEAFNRLKTLKVLLAAKSEEINIPIENLCSPEIVRKWCWLFPTQDKLATRNWFFAQGARKWQSEILAGLIESLLDNPEVD